ncbi:uncharacterized protein LOC117343755 [Pecten maximus]|uniref:uncharacterized protein LOC117343755 n=1 Tax=Pecten maximus TaxID=6579 RepID=UPI0014587CB6|nr:uncharacterized protein LOC117343755 [Pecten maximus]
MVKPRRHYKRRNTDQNRDHKKRKKDIIPPPTTKQSKKIKLKPSDIYQKEIKEYKSIENKSWTPNSTILIYAAKNDKREDLEYLQSAGKLEGAVNTLLEKALLHGHEELGKWFLHIGANLENMSKRVSLLHFAASNGYSDFLKALLEKHSLDTNATDEYHETALHLAIRNGNPEICRLLLHSGARTDIPDRDGLQPLHRAAQVKNIAQMIDILLEFKADIEAIDEHSKRPLEYAFERSINKHAAVCHLIKQGAKVGKTFVSQGSFFGKNAVQVGHRLGMTTTILRAVRYRNSEVNKKDLSVLDCVNLNGDIGSLVDLLKEDGNIMSLCDLNTDDTTKRLLSYIEFTGSHRLYQCMKERGLLVAKTPPYARKRDNINTLTELLRDSNILTNDVRETAILSHEKRPLGEQMMVLHFEAVNDVEFILTRGKCGSANTLMKDANSAELVVVVSPSKDEQSIQKVVALAAQHHVHRARGVFKKDSLTFTHIQTSDFLTDSNFLHGIRSDLQYSVLDSENKTVNLPEKKLKLTRRKSPYDLHSLHHHVLHNKVDELKKMLHNGKTIDVNVKDEAGWTALNLAILLGKKQMVEMLLDRGAIVTLDMAQYLPACVCGDWDRNAVVELSPLILSVRLNLTRILQLLIEKNSGHPSIDFCIKLSYGLKVESVLLESVCKTAERKHQAIGAARFKPTYTARMSRPIQRVCLGFSDDVSYKEEKGDIHGVHIAIMNKNISPESDWTEDTEMTEDEEVVSKAIIDLWADYLWEQHSNLNAITAGSLVRIKCEEMKRKGHIILHCSHKEYIPLESERFPTELTCEKGAMPVAVLEGEFRLAPTTNPLASGSISSREKAAAEKDEPDQSDNDIRSNTTQDVDRNRKHETHKYDIILRPTTKQEIKTNPKPSDIYQKTIEEYKKIENKSWTPNNTILIYATKNDKREDLEYLQSAGKLEGAVNTLLKKALLHGHEELGKWFLHIGANLENMSKHVPLLHFAASNGYSDFLKALLEKDSLDANATDEYHETTLHLAIRNGNPEICRLLLNSGARTDIPDRDGLQPLHRAAQVNNIAQMIDILLEFNADIEAIDEHSKRPLEYAFERSINKHAAVCHLIKQGAKVGKTFVSQGSFFGKNAVQVGHRLGMTTAILRAVRYRSSEVNKKDLFVLDCVNLTGDIGSLVDLLKEDGNIMSLCDLNTDDTTKRLLSYVELTGSHRLYQCMKERGLLVAKTPTCARKRDNIDTLTELLRDSNILTDDVRDTPILSHEQRQLGEQMMVLHFEAVNDEEFILTRGKCGSPNTLMKDAHSAELVVVVSPSKDEQSIQKVVALAAQHHVHRARGVFEKDSLTFKHIQTSDFLADSNFLHGIRSDLQHSVLVSENKTVNLLEKKLKLTRRKSAYDCYSLHHHVLYNEIDELRTILHSDTTIDVNVKDEAGWTTLNLAILLGEKQMVEMLLDCGATSTLDMAQYLPAFVCGNWDRNVELSSLILAVRLNLTDIVELLSERNPKHPHMDICIKLSYGLKVESVLLGSVCKTAERKYQDIGARFKPTYTVHMSQPIQRVCLGFSDDVCDKEEKGDIHGVQIAIMNKEISPESVWTEDTEMTEHDEVVSNAIIDLWADYLWDQHSNLNAITAGSIVELKYPRKKPVGHIILHCSHKGYIPLESNIFPTELTCQNGAMPVAVLEGEFQLGPYSKPSVSSSIWGYPIRISEHILLKIGMELCISDNVNRLANEGTLGIFVDMGNHKTGFITCAHLLHTTDIKNGKHPIYFPQQRHSAEACAQPDHSGDVSRQEEDMDVDDEPVDEYNWTITNAIPWECGKVVRAVFDTTLETGIDAALIEIDPLRVPLDGSFDSIKDIHLKHAAFNWRHPPTFTSGKQADTEYLNLMASSERPIRCMKVGVSSGLTVGFLTCKHGQVKMSDSDPLGIEKASPHEYILKNQFVITGSRRKQFFEPGDSGSAVFVMKGGRGQYYPDACLGIAIGFVDNNRTFVTPIGNILETLKSEDSSPLTLKTFE